MYDVVLLTEARYESPEKTDWYIDNILEEDRLVTEALERKGLKVGRFDWAGNFDWTQTRYALFRTTWDYFHRFDAFSGWLNNVSKQTQLLNVPSLIRWNMDKHYLNDLHQAGINIPKTTFIPKGYEGTLKDAHDEKGFTETVLKPTFSGAARHTYRINAGSIAEHEAIFTDCIAKEDMMLQEFQHNIVSKGEISMMVMGGQFTHAVIKKAKEGDFRVQDDFGGSVAIHEPTPEEIAFAEKAFAACPEPPLYGRADIFYDNNDKLAIGELELIEPELWFRYYPEAANTLANAIMRYMEEND